MASRTCNSCLRALKFQSKRTARNSIAKFTSNHNSTRAFATANDKYANLAEVNQNHGTSIPPVTPPAAGDKAGHTSRTSQTLAKEFQKVSGKGLTGTYTAYGATEELYKTCGAQADYSIPQASDSEAEMPKTEEGEDLGVGNGWWHDRLKPTFSTWSQVTMLHLYLLSVRLRCLPGTESQPWQQHLLDHFFYDAENKMIINHNMHARGTRNKYLKDMFVQWRGLLAAYDEGLAKGDAVLAAAVWRNVFKANENIDIKGLATIEVMSGQLTFRDPADEASLVGVKSKMMDLPLDKTQGKKL
ncbi:hypothetical protein SS1G_08808 [Sclerotinia sclerotiorum 1980 UF-70]|uniref:Ubiquinol-cytochrome c chaperone domain-containing protein n=1 Tax=Sclerotinia sclerotiorum (strain ATCC 18683 / 1980 / Ss-1) TaxID=665079 RepID=A7EU01_SCLS1|nr:hypothetical protein SS1G_08808 [Sclerotinia sclerotiorum 1980 UF-70]EDN92943.1 hypothetical protein SS1G_08808 [Sclerotinia sclerotiorum 1980 UF-70]